MTLLLLWKEERCEKMNHGIHIKLATNGEYERIAIMVVFLVVYGR